MDANITSISAAEYLFSLYISCDEGDLVFTNKGNKVAAVFSVTATEEAAQFIENYKGTDLYLKINPMNHEQTIARNPHGVGGVKEVCAIIGFHLDIDCEKSAKYPTRDEALAALDAMPMKPSLIINTNGTTGGFHAYWLLDEPIKLVDDKVRQQASQASQNWLQLLREKLPGKTIDGTANIDRVLRPLGSLRSSGNRVTAHRFEPQERYSFQSFVDLVPPYVPTFPAGHSTGESVIAKYLDAREITVWSILRDAGYTELGNGEWLRPGSESGARTGIEYSVDRREGFTVLSGNAAPLSCENPKGGTGHWYSREALWLSFHLNVDANANRQAWQDGADIAKEYLDREAVEYVCLDQLLENLGSDDNDELGIDDEQFAMSVLPSSGLLRDLHDAYWQSSFRRCSTMGLAASLAICQTLFGRKVFSWTRLATNDYHLILAPTASGKEGPLKFATEVLASVDMALPEKMQSGNGLLAALRQKPASLWACDEFGYLLEAVLDSKKGNPVQREIACLLLSLYTKSAGLYMGSAYAQKVEQGIQFPNLSVLGVSTGSTVWSNVSQRQVHDGLLGRICFWRVGERPQRNRETVGCIPDSIFETVQRWAQWTPSTGNLGSINPAPMILMPTDEARERWESHEDGIEAKADAESAMRAALWGRVAARSQKLAIVHRLARLAGPEEINEFNPPVMVELEDVNFGIAVANWSARLACDLVNEKIVDDSSLELQRRITGILREQKQVELWRLNRSLRSFSNSEVRGMLVRLEREGALVIEQQATKGRTKEVIRWLAS